MNSEYIQIIKQLKIILRERKITYANLAEKMDVSEVTIKRIFSSSDGNISKLSKICEIIGITFFDLVNEASPKESKSFSLTEKQQRFFEKNINHFFVFLYIVENEKSFDELLTFLDTTEKRLFSYMKKFDELGLLELHPNNEIKLLVHGSLDIPKGVLGNIIMSHTLKEMTERILCPENSKNTFNTLSVLKITRKLYEQFNNDFAQLMKDIQLRAERDLRLSNQKDLETVTLNIHLDAWDPLESIIRGIKF